MNNLALSVSGHPLFQLVTEFLSSKTIFSSSTVSFLCSNCTSLGVRIAFSHGPLFDNHVYDTEYVLNILQILIGLII